MRLELKLPPDPADDRLRQATVVGLAATAAVTIWLATAR
jgi:hypothetical protein